MEQPGKFHVGVAVHQVEDSRHCDEKEQRFDQVKNRDENDAPVTSFTFCCHDDMIALSWFGHGHADL